jgi:hypothetical protein
VKGYEEKRKGGEERGKGRRKMKGGERESGGKRIMKNRGGDEKNRRGEGEKA